MARFDSYFDPDRYLSSGEGCAICLRHVDDCICPACPRCGETGNPDCYRHRDEYHDVLMVEASPQIASRQEYEDRMRLEAEGQAFEAMYEEIATAFGMWDQSNLSPVENECWYSLALAMHKAWVTTHMDDFWAEEARLQAERELRAND